MITLSHFQAATLLAARQSGLSQARVSLDLNRSLSSAALNEQGAAGVAWAILEKIASDENGCFQIEGGQAIKIQAFSELTGRHISLYPTEGAPTMLVGGFPMHRIKGTDPWRDTEAKIRAASPTGRVLDTTTGLGYTAIQAAQGASGVVTVELDPAVQAVARGNPWSQALFTDARIDRRLGDSYDLIETFADGEFARIIHDPPTLALAGDLYSGAFYRQCWRVLAPGGRLFHYIGDPDSKSGAQVTRGVIRRLGEAGFTRIRPAREAFGVTAQR
jgi:hypothetical protein